MTRRVLLAAAGALALFACHSPSRTLDDFAVAAATPARTSGYRLYKFLQPIGFESDTFTPTPDGGQEAKASFTFNDRGSDVPLAASYRLDRDGNVSRYDAFGSVARGAGLDDHVRALGGDRFAVRRLGMLPRERSQPAPRAVSSGYAPMLGQELLLRAWLRAGRPAKLALLPEGEATFDARGRERYDLDGKPVTLEHVAVGGLSWGREDVWIDDQQQLAAVVTRDAEFDHFEGVRRDFTGLVDRLVARAGSDAVAWLAGAVHSAPAQGPVALVGGRLIDGSGAPPLEDAVVVYQGDRILAAGPRATTAIPPGAEVIDLHGGSVLPGLWDMHAHIEQVEQAAVYLAAGVTSARDEGNIMPFITALRDTIDSGKGIGPRIIVDGLVDGVGKEALGTLQVSKPADVAPVIEQLVENHCAELKIYSSVPPELVPLLTAEAHRRGLRVTGHIPFGMTMEQAVDDGYDGVNHATSLFSMFMPTTLAALRKLGPDEAVRRLQAESGDSPELQRLFAKMVAHHVIFDPTLALMELYWLPIEQLRRSEPGLARLPRELAGNFTGAQPDNVARSLLFWSKLKQLVGAARRAGVTIVAGTDQGVLGFSLARELELYVEAGMTPLQALASATSVPAHVLGHDDLGVVAAGKRADLIVVAGNPAVNISDVRKVTRVIARGRRFDPAPLWKLVGYQP